MGLKDLEKEFKRIEEIGNYFQSGMIEEAQDCIKYLDELTGYYMYLNTMLARADAEFQKKEAEEYNKERGRVETSGGKAVNTVIEKTIAPACMDAKKTKNIIRSYLESCERGISSCQSKLKYLTEEAKFSHRDAKG